MKYYDGHNNAKKRKWRAVTVGYGVTGRVPQQDRHILSVAQRAITLERASIFGYADCCVRTMDPWEQFALNALRTLKQMSVNAAGDECD